MNLRLTSLLAVALAGFLLLSGCEHQIPPMPRPEGRLAVAGFTNPRFDWQLMAGYVPQEGRALEKDTLAELDEAMLMVLADHQVTDFVSPKGTRQCQEIVTFETGSGKKKPALEYWIEVGKCMKTDYLLVPQILYWRERVGDAYTVESPASVVLDFYLIQIAEPNGIVRKHYDETQKSLSEDLGHAEKFFNRDGKWVTAKYLAVEGMDIMLREMGL